MKRLYTPFKVNKLELKNRVIMSPMSIGHTVDGFIMDDVVEFYKRRAQGGVGLIIFANMQWDKLRYNPNHGAMLTDEKYIPSLKKLTDAIHEGGSKVFAQLMHRGRCANRASIQGEQAVAPSPIPGRFTHFEMPKELTVEEIKEFVDWQAEAAVIAKKAGFDGIEIETNSGYLYGQFFSPLTNHRTDEYGGSLENRCRFMVETLEVCARQSAPTILSPCVSAAATSWTAAATATTSQRAASCLTKPVMLTASRSPQAGTSRQFPLSPWKFPTVHGHTSAARSRLV